MKCFNHGLLIQPGLGDFVVEKIITAVPFFTALFALFTHADRLLWPMLYLALIGGHMVHILFQRCPNCAYYKVEGKLVACLWWRWVPKLRAAREGPAPAYIKTYTPFAIIAITVFPIYWLAQQWELLVIYGLSWAVLFSSIVTNCKRCIDFGCKFNATPDEVKQAYLDSTS